MTNPIPEPKTNWLALLGFAATVAGLGFAVFLGAPDIGGFLNIPRVYVRLLGGLFALSGFAFPPCYYVRFRFVRENQLGIEVSEIKSELTSVQARLRWKDMDQAARTVAVAKSLWEATNDHQHSGYRFEDDPVNLQFALDPKLANLAAQPMVQRLNHIKQLSFAYLKFRSATHTRLAHSLGACKNAETVMRRIFHENRIFSSQSGEENINNLTQKEKDELVNLARVTALLHDLGHGPLSHALDIHLGVRRKPPTTKPDREFSIAYIDKYLRQSIKKAGADPDRVIRLLQKDRVDLDPWMHFIADLVDSPLDVDRMDYLARDAHMTGLTAGAQNMQALIERIVPFKEAGKDGAERIELAFELSAVPYIEQFIYARDVMYIHCYEDPSKIAAEKMLGRAFEEFAGESQEKADATFEDLALMTDQQITELILNCCGPKTIAFRMLQLLMRGSVFECIDEIPVPVDLRPPNWESVFNNVPPEIHDRVREALRKLDGAAAGPAPARRGGWPQRWEEWDRVVKALPAETGETARKLIREQRKVYLENMIRNLPTEIKSWAKNASFELLEQAYLKTPEGWAKALAQMSKVDYSKIIVAVPSWSIVDNWKRETDVRILIKEGENYSVDHIKRKDISPIIEDFVGALAGVRLKVRVFVDPDLGSAERERVRESADKYLR